MSFPSRRKYGCGSDPHLQDDVAAAGSSSPLTRSFFPSSIPAGTFTSMWSWPDLERDRTAVDRDIEGNGHLGLDRLRRLPPGARAAAAAPRAAEQVAQVERPSSVRHSAAEEPLEEFLGHLGIDVRRGPAARETAGKAAARESRPGSRRHPGNRPARPGEADTGRSSPSSWGRSRMS